ncbi:MAG: hypothetical protein IT330_07745 [Anaerolineae bacterium]|nr:hypothetical protein [Anaerolineae bacterium]
MPAIITCVGNRFQTSHLVHPASGHDFLPRGQHSPLWEIELREAARKQETGRRLNSTQARAITVEETAAATTYRFSSFDLGDERGVVEVVVTMQPRVRDASRSGMRPLPGHDASEWRISVYNRSARYGLWTVTFPILSQLAASAEAELFMPEGWGVVHRDPIHADLRLPTGWNIFDDPTIQSDTFAVDYPMGLWTMQFVALCEGRSGLYLAAHDREGHQKRFQVIPHPVEERLAWQITHYPAEMGAAGKDYHLPYPVVVGTFTGDWIDAAKIYRQWAKGDSIWFPPTPTEMSQETPQWFKEIALWGRVGVVGSRVIAGDAATAVPEALRFAEHFGVPVAVHWYGWHQIPFDDHYPEYLPPKEGFKEGVAKLRAAGVRVIPYINGRLFDPRTESWQREGAAAFCALNEHGEKYEEIYGQSPPLSPMCPKTPYWQNKIASIVEELVGEYGVDGVYIDQIGAAAPKLCFNPAHPHAAGGGHFWVEGYREMLQRARTQIRRKNPDAVLVTEDGAEPYSGLLDGFLMCNQTMEAMVPAYPAVYGDVNLTFGRYLYAEDAEAIWPFRVKAAQMFTFGAQMGWLSAWIFDFPREAEYLKMLAQVRYRSLKYLAYGELVHPPMVDAAGLPAISTQWELWRKAQRVTVLPILYSAWQAPDGALGIAVTNLSDDAHPFRWTLDPQVHPVARGGNEREVHKSGPNGVESSRVVPAHRRVGGEETVPPRSAFVLEIAPGF